MTDRELRSFKPLKLPSSYSFSKSLRALLAPAASTRFSAITWRERKMRDFLVILLSGSINAPSLANVVDKDVFETFAACLSSGGCDGGKQRGVRSADSAAA